MKAIINFLKKIFPSIPETCLSVLIGLCAGAAIYLGTLQRHFFSKRYLAYALLIAVAAAILAATLIQFVLKCKFRKQSRPIRWLLLVAALLFALITLANVTIQPLYYLLPDTQMTIHIPIGDVPQGQESVRLLWVSTGQGYVHYTNMNIEGQWERVGKNILFAPNQDVTISWQGKAGSQVEAAFRMTAYEQPVTIRWDGISQTYSLNDLDESKVVIENQFDETLLPNMLIRSQVAHPLLYDIPFALTFTISIGFLYFVLLIVLGAWPPRWQPKTRQVKYGWLAYMLPMLVLWGISLLTFWPGIVTNDSLSAWTQSLSGSFNDWQSALYALVLAGLMKVWYSPAIVTILQVLLFAFLVAWGLRAFERMGVPRGFLWVISILFAISPLNNLYAITLWRDIPYALAILWLTILVLKVYLSRGSWVKGWGWIWLALAGFLIAILRQNGVPVAFGMLALLPIVYRKYWKQLSGSLLLALFLFLFTKGPVYSWVDVDRSKSGQSNLILLHHMAAHLDAGTPLEPEELAYMDSFLPASDWQYYCCYVGTISYNDAFERDRFLISSQTNRALALDLFKRDPGVDIRHTFCAGELVWRMNDNYCHMKSTHGFSSWKPGAVSWVVDNEVGLESDSKIPTLVQPYVDSLRIFGFRDDYLDFYLRPALYLYLGLFFSVVIVIRRSDFRALLVCLPILAQSLILLLVSYAPAIRYQYGTIITGLFLVGLAFLPNGEKAHD